MHVVRQFKFPQTETKLLTVITLRRERKEGSVIGDIRVQMITLECEIKRSTHKNWYCTQNQSAYAFTVSLFMCIH